MSKLEEVNKNNTFRFLFPIMYKKDVNDYTFLKDEFEGIYLHKEDNKLILVYKPSNTESFNSLDKELVELKNFDTDVDMKDGRIAYIYKIPTRFQEEVSKFKEGKYSEFSDKYKQQILDFWGLTEGDDPVHGILMKNEVGKATFDKFSKKHKNNTAKGEYYPKPNMDEEYLEI